MELQARAGSDRLESWKEIATYLGRGLRTVQRWEREEGLPVRRHHHSKLGSVWALRPELDAWRLARVKATAAPDAGRKKRVRWPAGVAVVAVGLLATAHSAGRTVVVPAEDDPAARRLAVLPFRNLTGDASLDLISHGLTEETVTQMARQDLRSFSVLSVQDSTPSADGAAAAHQDGYRLEGSVRRVGGRLRVAARLVQEADRRLVWAETFERAEVDTAAQAELARSITSAASAALAR
jgi:TolB-like protein